MKKENEIEIVKNVDVNNPLEIIQQAISKGADLDKIEKLMILQERWEATQAKKEYFKAMAEFKANPPRIDKDHTVKFETSKGTTSYNHATLGNVAEKINMELSKHGLSACWTIQQNGVISVTCKIVHIKGYSEETTITAPSDQTGSKNSIQAIGSTITYLQRYTILSLTGLATYDDDDGRASVSPIELINSEEAKQINILVEQSKISREKFLEWLEVGDVTNIPKNMFPKAIKVLEAKLKKKIESEGTKK